MSAGKKYQIDDRQDQHGNETYDRTHDIKWRSILFGKWPKSPKACELQASQLDEADRVFGDVPYRRIAIGEVAGNRIRDFFELRKFLIDVADAAAWIVGVVAAVKREICSEMEAHERAISVIIVDPPRRHQQDVDRCIPENLLRGLGIAQAVNEQGKINYQNRREQIECRSGQYRKYGADRGCCKPSTIPTDIGSQKQRNK